ncbi:hypothetical protein Poli38472_004706 [Pythium oligandrum]|uniref:Uncharacterized protein n=1 Tax=Pythium oligandrum TaxID=41045 RepID=A0A8K1CC48_PYTOL|nr:hypothetical protein Poli38472_004706 [Pythium oligandrum]|eukprot:TMW59637.1 hypothetical protein Poli38472_004706 [Pythium oligandrum]
MNSIIYGLAVVALVPSWYYVSVNEQYLAATLPSECNKVLDSVIFYEPGLVYPYLTCMGEFGRAKQMDFYKFDLIFPFIFGMYDYGSLTRLWPEARASMGAFGLLTTLFDQLENTFTILALVKFPEQIHALAVGVSVFAGLKWVFFFASSAVVLAGLARLVLRAVLPGKTTLTKKTN